ncbi:MAG TPA: alanine--tRNA ligase, partial [Lachnospiraceae bacterium]|nr:alanine--tRNA ligase [Lachnospiraceae bacterium]
ELCGGTHVSNTREIVYFKIVSESGIAAGVRRIEAHTSVGLIDILNNSDRTVKNLSRLLKSTPADIEDRVMRLLDEIKELKRENEKMKSAIARDAAGDVNAEAVDVSGISVITKQIDDVEINDLRSLGDDMKNKLGECVIVLASVKDGKVGLMATATEKAMEKGAHAGNLIKKIAPVVNGGGGGRPNMAQAGGKDPSKVGEALDMAMEEIRSQLG